VVVEEASMVVAVLVAVVFTAVAEVSAVATSAVQAVAACALLARDRGSLHLGIHQIDNLSIPDDLAEWEPRLFAQQERLVSRRIVSAHLEQLHNVD
jgi:hypothetical protein